MEGHQKRSPLQQLEAQPSTATSLLLLPTSVPATLPSFPCTPGHWVHAVPCHEALQAWAADVGGGSCQSEPLLSAEGE